MSFTIFYNEKTPFQAIKTRSSKSQNIDIFLNGLTHGFGQKMAIFPIFFFRQYRPGKYSFTIFYNEKTPFQAIKRRSSKSQKIDVFQRGQPMVSFKTWPFFQLYFQAIKARKMSFTIFNNEKTPFQAIKTKSSKSRKLTFFERG